MNKEVEDSLAKLKAEVKKHDEEMKEARKNSKLTKELEASNEGIKKRLEDLEQKLKSEGRKLKRKKSD